MTNHETARDFGQLYESVVADLRAARAITNLIAVDTDGNDAATDAAMHLSSLLRDDLETMEALWKCHHEDFERKRTPATVTRDEWSQKDLNAELLALSARIAGLPEHGVRELLDLALNLVAAHNPNGGKDRLTLAEIDSLIASGIGPKHIHSFWWLKDRGVAQLVPAAKGEGE